VGRIAQISWSVALVLGAADLAHAHIKLLKPASWVEEDSTGDPQKEPPCGPGAGGGDETGMVTTYTEGEEITVEWSETINHNGHYRIALARDRSELVDPKVNGTCQSADIMDPPVAPVLMDGLFPTTSDDGKRMFSQKVKLPAGMTCEKCTLQLLQFMTPHLVPCFYYHCADIKIVPAGGGAAGGGGAAPAAGSGVTVPAAGGGGGAPAPAAGAGAAPAAVNGGTGAAAGRPAAAAGAAAPGGPPRGNPATGGAPVSQTASPSMAQPTAAGQPAATPVGAAVEDSGCSVARSGVERNGTLAAFMLLIALRAGTRARRKPSPR
jgi:hypothetical protein